MWGGDSPTFLGPVTVPGAHSQLLPVRAWHLGGTRVLSEQTPPWCWMASQKEQHQEIGSPAEPKGLGREGSPQPVALPSLSPRRGAPHSARSRPKPHLGAPGSSSLGTERVVGAGQQHPLPSLTSLQGTPPQNHCWHFGSLQAPRGHGLPGAPPNTPVGLRELQPGWARAGEGGRGLWCSGWVTAGKEADPGAEVGVPGLEGLWGCCQARGHPPAGPVQCCSGKEGANPTPSPPSPPRAVLTFIWRCGESNQLCLLLPAERSLGKPQRNSSSRGSIPPPLPSLSHHGTPRRDAAPDLGPFQASSAARSVPVPVPIPALPGTGTAAPSAPTAAAEPPLRSPLEPFPASNESPAHGPASPSPQHIFFFFSPSCQADLAVSQPLCRHHNKPSCRQSPGTISCHCQGDGRPWHMLLPPPKVHRDGLATPKPCPGCKKVWQLCSIPAYWGWGCWSTPGMLEHARDGDIGALCGLALEPSTQLGKGLNPQTLLLALAGLLPLLPASLGAAPGSGGCRRSGHCAETMLGASERGNAPASIPPLPGTAIPVPSSPGEPWGEPFVHIPPRRGAGLAACPLPLPPPAPLGESLRLLFPLAQRGPCERLHLQSAEAPGPAHLS